MVEERELLIKIIHTRAIRTDFQPIVSTAGAIVVGYEALSRGPVGTRLETPDALFTAANNHNLLWDLEVACRSLALERAREQRLQGYLFINVDSRVLYDPKFREGLTAQLINEHSLDPEQIVLEITEKTSIDDYRAFREALRHYTRQGYKIAIDDAGAGYSGMRTIAETHPQFIKLDMGLVRGIDKDPMKQSVARHFIGMCQGASMKLIAEGVETPQELATLMELGVEYVQGYLLGRPQGEIVSSLSCEVREQMDRIRAERARQSYRPSSYAIGVLARLDSGISEQATGMDARRMLAENGVQGLPVVRDGYLVGLIMKHSCDALLATPYGNALYLDRSVSFLMDRSPLIVEYEAALTDVARQAMSRREEKLYDYVIVVNQGKYYGVTTIKQMLEKMSQLEANYARHQNPLTSLPGNRLRHERLDQLLFTAEEFFTT